MMIKHYAQGLDYVQRFWIRFAVAGVAFVFLIASVFIVETLPPRTIVMATESEGSAQYEMGIRYREILAQSGVKVQILQTAGSLENLARLRDAKSGVVAGFIQGGTTTHKESPELVSLGTEFYEPLWFFYRSELGGAIQAVNGRPISIGPEGSGGRALALELIKRLKIEGIVGELLPFAPLVAAEKLIAGTIDAAIIVSAWDSPAVQRLMNAKGIELSAIPRADAYVAIYPFLNKLVLPAGVADMFAGRPPADVVLIAPKASLAVRADLHPGIQHLLLNAAAQIHSQPGIFQKAGQFPAAESVDIPLSEEAQLFYKSGRPFLQKALPFWIATLVEKVLFVFVPLAALLYPMFKLLPQFYDWIMQLRIRRLYEEMWSIESEMEGQRQGHDANAINEKLDRLSQRADRLRLPSAYASSLYTLRSHIGMVRARLKTSPDLATR